MKFFLAAVCFCLGLSLLPACSTVPVPEIIPSPRLSIEGMIIRNGLPYPVTEVMINVPETGAFAGCGNILPNSFCRTSFETVDYSGNALVVTWKEHGQAHTTGEFVVEQDNGIDMSRPAWLEVTVFAAGQAGAKFIQLPD